MGIVEKIADIENEIKRTQKNKGMKIQYTGKKWSIINPIVYSH